MIKLYTKDGMVRRQNAIVLTEVTDGISFDVFNPSEEMLLASGWEVYEPQTAEVEIPQEEQYKRRIIDLIHERYSTDDEIAILRQRDSKPEEFAEYNAYVEQCKTTAHNEVYGNERL